jgi:hypothetical protein
VGLLPSGQDLWLPIVSWWRCIGLEVAEGEEGRGRYGLVAFVVLWWFNYGESRSRSTLRSTLMSRFGILVREYGESNLR